TAGVSRGTLYRLFPGKAALLRSMVESFAPFEAIHRSLATHGEQPADVVLPEIARTVVGIAEGRMGLMRAIFHEATGGSPTSVAGVRPVLQSALGALSVYISGEMAAGRVRRMEPLLALQAFIGPIYFHLMTRPVAEEVMGLRTPADQAVQQVVQAVLHGLLPDR
ncbi:MAG TPA: hypothetical protein VHK28_08800, partial [Candidatus Limnocylindria bacterium]|nr:hypothetical protein [Candidatus Limnocylindria bacterium]